MIEIGRRLLGDGRQHAEAHQDVSFGVEQHQPTLGTGQRETQRKPGMPAHRRVAERHVKLGTVCLLDPVAAAAAGHDDRIGAMGTESVERLLYSHHPGQPSS